MNDGSPASVHGLGTTPGWEGGSIRIAAEYMSTLLCTSQFSAAIIQHISTVILMLHTRVMRPSGWVKGGGVCIAAPIVSGTMPTDLRLMGVSAVMHVNHMGYMMQDSTIMLRVRVTSLAGQ